MCKRKRCLYNKRTISKLESTCNRDFWAYIRRLTGKPRSEPNITLEEWYEHFKGVFTLPNYDSPAELGDKQVIIDDIEDVIFNSCITYEEIYASIKSLNVKKAVDGNVIPQQLIYVKTVLLPFLSKLFNRLYMTGEFPVSWTKCIIVPLHKKGNINSTNNYRGISLLDVVSKLYISIITTRLTFYAEAYDRLYESQSGFRVAHSTIDNAYVLYGIIQKYFCLKTKAVYVAFRGLHAKLSLLHFFLKLTFWHFS